MGGNEGSDGRNRPRILVEMGSRCRGGPDLKAPEADMLAAHEAVTTNSRKAQNKFGKMFNQRRDVARTASLEQLPGTGECTPAGSRYSLGGSETKVFARAPYRRLHGAGDAACLRARPTDSLRVRVRRHGKALHRDRGTCDSEVSCWDGVDVDTRHTHLSQSRGAGEPVPTTSPRYLPHVEAARNSTPNGECRTVHWRQEPADGHRY